VTYQIASGSVEYLPVPLLGTYTTSMPVAVAVVLEDTKPTDTDWHVAQWDVDGTSAKLLTGPGTALALAAELYGVWARITATPEIPAIYCYQLLVT
jgi:hypothetical protein